jgi:Ca-activated chloride channel family protein
MIELTSPFWLVGLLATPLFLIGFRRRRIGLLALRLVAFILLVLALAQPLLLHLAPGGILMVLADTSRSAQVQLSSNDFPSQTGINVQLVPFGGPHSSDLGQALLGAAALLPAGGGKVVLLSDGQDTGNRVEEGIAALRSKRLIADVVAYSPSRTDASLLLEAPSYLASGERFALVARIQSRGVGQVAFVLTVDGKEALRQQLSLQEGQSLFSFPMAFWNPGIHVMEGTISSPEDTLLENNSASAFATVIAPRQVLVVSSQPNGGAFAGFLQDQGIPSTQITPSNLPDASLALSAYEGVVLVDVSREELGSLQVSALEDYVRGLGGGLLAIGGGHSFTLGGYFRSDLEEILPVISKPRLEEDLPEMAVVFVIDNSSSMWNQSAEVKKLDLAQEVAIRAAATLRSKDQVGVLIFSDSPQWLLDLGAGRDFSQIKEKILTEGPGGGTNAYLALREAFQQLAKSDASLKHVIFVSDGKAREGDFAALVEEGQRNGVYTTALAVGLDADTSFMESLAQLGGGKYAAVSSPDQIPAVLFPPNDQRPEKPIAEGPATLRFSAPTSGIPSIQPPDLAGYLKVQVKPGAEVVYQASPRQEGVLTVWLQGGGRVAAWVADFSGEWTVSWEQWKEQGAFWMALWRWVAPATTELATSLQLSGDELRVEISSPDDTRPALLLEGPAGQSIRLQAERVSPSRFEATYSLWGRGAYTLNASQGDRQSLLAFWLPERELSGVGIDWPTMGRIAEESGGKVRLGIDENLWDGLPIQEEKIDLTPWLLLGCIVCYLSEVGLRRLRGAFRDPSGREEQGIDRP